MRTRPTQAGTPTWQSTIDDAREITLFGKDGYSSYGRGAREWMYLLTGGDIK